MLLSNSSRHFFLFHITVWRTWDAQLHATCQVISQKIRGGKDWDNDWNQGRDKGLLRRKGEEDTEEIWNNRISQSEQCFRVKRFIAARERVETGKIYGETVIWLRRAIHRLVEVEGHSRSNYCLLTTRITFTTHFFIHYRLVDGYACNLAWWIWVIQLWTVWKKIVTARFYQAQTVQMILFFLFTFAM